MRSDACPRWDARSVGEILADQPNRLFESRSSVLAWLLDKGFSSATLTADFRLGDALAEAHNIRMIKRLNPVSTVSHRNLQ